MSDWFSFEFLKDFKYPSLPEAPYITLNSALVALSASFLSYNTVYTLSSYKNLPKTISFKPIPNLPKEFSFNKKFLLGLPAGGAFGLVQTIFLAANTHLIRSQLPFNISESNKSIVDSMMANFIYVGLFVSQMSLLQTNFRITRPDVVNAKWFKIWQGGMGLGMLGVYITFGYKIKQLMNAEQEAKEAVFSN